MSDPRAYDAPDRRRATTWGGVGRPADPNDVDERSNNVLAAGAILAALCCAPTPALLSVEPMSDESGTVTNQIDVRLSFMKSPYRLTIERIRADPDDSGD